MVDYRRRHRWDVLGWSRGPRGAVRLVIRCRRCLREIVGYGRARLPPCDSRPLWNPCTDLWVARFRELNRRAPPPERPALADLGEWWG